MLERSLPGTPNIAGAVSKALEPRSSSVTSLRECVKQPIAEPMRSATSREWEAFRQRHTGAPIRPFAQHRMCRSGVPTIALCLAADNGERVFRRHLNHADRCGPALAARLHSRRPTFGGTAERTCLCHGSDSRVDCVVVTVGDHRAVCSLQPAAADRRPRIRGVAAPRTGVAACRRGFGNVDRKRPQYFRERGEVRRGGVSGLQLRREGRGRRRATRARRFGVLR